MDLLHQLARLKLTSLRIMVSKGMVALLGIVGALVITGLVFSQKAAAEPEPEPGSEVMTTDQDIIVTIG